MRRIRRRLILIHDRVATHLVAMLTGLVGGFILSIPVGPIKT